MLQTRRVLADPGSGQSHSVRGLLTNSKFNFAERTLLFRSFERRGRVSIQKKKKKVNETPQVGGDGVDGVDGVERTTFDGVPEALVSSNPTVPNCLGMSILVKMYA